MVSLWSVLLSCESTFHTMSVNQLPVWSSESSMCDGFEAALVSTPKGSWDFWFSGTSLIRPAGQMQLHSATAGLQSTGTSLVHLQSRPVSPIKSKCVMHQYSFCTEQEVVLILIQLINTLLCRWT